MHYVHWIALCGELALEEALDLSQDRLLNEMNVCNIAASVIQPQPGCQGFLRSTR